MIPLRRSIMDGNMDDIKADEIEPIQADDFSEVSDGLRWARSRQRWP